MKSTDGVSIFEKQPELMKQESWIKKSEEYEVVDLDEEDTKPNELPAVDEEEDEEDAQKPQAKQEGMKTRAMKERRRKGGRREKGIDEK